MERDYYFRNYYLPAQTTSDFIDSVRIGLDLGEWTGGIAVVRGNEILHAESYVDFHGMTIEGRRNIRRGRRTRHAKKKRLARLRSWVLRQKLPDGTRLPDPYVVMHDKKFMVKPEIFGKKGIDPVAAPDWIQKAKNGNIDPSGFVRALALIFRKRGYMWDGAEMEKKSDAELKDFLENSRIPPDAASEIEAIISFRKENPDTPERGKKKVTPDNLLLLLKEATEREKQPRKAEHRDIRKADLDGVIDGAARSFRIPGETTDKWKKELKQILDKPVRKTRFNNRIKTTCAWCDNPTPRKKKVKELSYLAAVGNVRVQEASGQKRPLSDEEKKIFFQWWKEKDDTDKRRIGETGIKNTLKKLNADEEMARQLYDLLRGHNMDGRARLCRKHLEMAAEGKNMYDAGVDWQTMKTRTMHNPCREQHDERIIRRLENILFISGEKGEEAWRYGPVRFISVEAPLPGQDKKKKKGRGKKKEKGEVPERKTDTLKERLIKEIGGKCLYTGKELSVETVEIEHIHPRSMGGPDLQENFTVTSVQANKEKANRTPFMWFGKDQKKWSNFVERVNNAQISDRKKQILLNEEDDYPDNPTPLARTSSRYRQFVRDIQLLFDKYGVEPPVPNYQLGKPHIQRVEGWDTQRLRRSWSNHKDGTENFPEKDRLDLFNHAQDAALAAALPPHTWRARIWRSRREIINEETGEFIRIHEVPRVLAPDWNVFMDNRTGPILQVLGNYGGSWKRGFSDLNFVQLDGPEPMEYKNLKQRIPIGRYVVGKNSLADKSMETRINKTAHLEGIKDGGSIPEDKLDILGPEGRRPRHVTTFKPKGGPVLSFVKPSDGPNRIVQFKGVSEGCILWKKKDGRKGAIEMSRIYSSPLKSLGINAIDPPLEPGSEILGSLHKYQIIHLDEKGDARAGWYIVKEFGKSGVVTFPEHYYPIDVLSEKDKEYLKEINQDKKGKKEKPLKQAAERSIGKTELAEYFEKRRAEKRKRKKG
ncbi:MAG TPA: HNH endonuclease domain-containing protein [bacterium]|nr:HNH endonuclease domain-containing protein [bacterium]